MIHMSGVSVSPLDHFYFRKSSGLPTGSLKTWYFMLSQAHHVMGCMLISGSPELLSLQIAFGMTLLDFFSLLYFPFTKAMGFKKRETKSPAQSIARFVFPQWKQIPVKWFCTRLGLALSGSVATGVEMQRSKSAEHCKTHWGNQISVLASWDHEPWPGFMFDHPCSHQVSDIGLGLTDFILGDKLNKLNK